MLSSNLNSRVDSKDIVKYAVVKLEKFTVNTLLETKYLSFLSSSSYF